MEEQRQNNPFNISFGEVPTAYVPRTQETQQILNSFTSETPDTRIYVLAGPRGSGKTVLLTQIKEIFDNENGWITIDLNPHGNMLEQLCAKLYEKGQVKKLFLKAEFNFSFQGLSFSLRGDNPVSNIDSLAEKMLEYLRKKGIRTLVTIDDIHPNDHVKYFAHAYQSFIRERYQIFLLATGLYENISSLENDKGLTFLVRAPKVYMEKLSLAAITHYYRRLLGVEEAKAIQLAKLTMGYAYGFQLLGNLLYQRHGEIDDAILEKFDLRMEDNVYSLIWKALTPKEKELLTLIAEGNLTTAEILSKGGFTNSSLQVYRGKMAKAGLIDSSIRGRVALALPRFREYILLQKEFED